MTPRPLPRILAALAAVLTLTSCTPNPGPSTVTPSATAQAAVSAEVIAVVDGDTIDVRTPDGAEARVRLIGLDSPEIGRDGAADECYAQEARDWLDAELYGVTVHLEADPTQDDADRYGRLLRHVYVDGQSAALGSIAAGAAYEYTYDVPYQHQAEHQAAEAEARADQLGLWGVC